MTKHKLPWANAPQTPPNEATTVPWLPPKMRSLQPAACKRSIGEAYENRALNLLQQHGLVLLERNFNTRFGEVDLIMREGPCAVCVEVRHRAPSQHGSALDSIGYFKQKRVSKAATVWWRLRGHRMCSALRFDVVAFEGQKPPVWLKHAWLIDN